MVGIIWMVCVLDHTDFNNNLFLVKINCFCFNQQSSELNSMMVVINCFMGVVHVGTSRNFKHLWTTYISLYIHVCTIMYKSTSYIIVTIVKIYKIADQEQ